MLKKNEILQSLPFNVSDKCKKRIEELEIDAIKTSGQELERCILKIVREIIDNQPEKAGEHRRKDWKTGWEENYKEYIKGKDIRALIPGYYNKYNFIRFNGHLYTCQSSSCELNSVRILINSIADAYLKDLDSIVELGAGTCHHIVELSKSLSKGVSFFALDWSDATKKIATELSNNHQVEKIHGYKCDFFDPCWEDNENKPHGKVGVYSFAAFEQLGNNYMNMVEFIIEMKPSIVIQLEPLTETLPDSELLPYLSKKYSEKRGYLEGYTRYLTQLQEDGKIELLTISRMPFGSLFIEGYSLVAWKPV